MENQSIMADEQRLTAQIKIFEAKKQTLFQRIQRLYDWSKDIGNPHNLRNFKSLYGSLHDTRSQLTEVVEKINFLNIELDPEYTPNFQLLDTIEQLFCVVQETGETVCREIFSNSDNPGASGGATIETHRSKAMPKLPKIEIKEFCGDPKLWPVFYGMYTSLVHDNKDLDDTCKIHYLLSRLTGRALALCSGIPPIAANYHIIWKILVDKYQDKRSLACNYLKQILDFKPLQSESAHNLNIFLERFDTSVNALKQLDIPNLADFLLTYVALSKLDSQTRRSFEISAKDIAIPNYGDLADFVKQQTKILSRTSSNSFVNNGNISKSTATVMSAKPKITHSFVNTNSKSYSSCPACKQESHLITKCAAFLRLSPLDRYKLAKEKHLCLNCLSDKHRIVACKSINACSICKIRHHSLLHFNKETPTSAVATTSSMSNVGNNSLQSEQPISNITTLSLCSTANNKLAHQSYTTLLSTAVVNIQLPTGENKPIRILLDSASQANFLSLKCCKKLQLPFSKMYSSVIGIGASSKPVKGQVNNITISSRFDASIQFQCDALVVEKITDNFPTAVIHTEALSYLMDLPLADAEFYKSSEIDGILGAELFPQLVGVGKMSSTPDLPIALQTRLGYVVMGKAPIISTTEKPYSFCSIVDPPIEKIMQKFLEIEDIPISQIDSPENMECEKHFQTTYTRDINGRFTVALPFKNDPTILGDSYSIALRRFLSLEKKLNSSSDFRNQYNNVIQDYLDQGHMRKLATETDSTLPSYYIPHHAVFKIDSSSTPLRVVFDASAKTDTSYSLNDILHTGPKLQSDVLAMFLNFRLYPIAFTADIRQMYRQVNLCDAHKRFQRLLWRFNANEPIETLEISTLAFGVKPSPFLALRAVHQLANDESKIYPHASEIVLRDMYIDDLVSSVGNLKEAKLVFQQLIDLFNAGGFSLVKWSVNSKEFLNHIPEEKRLSQIVNFETDCLKVLGMQWHPNLDILFFKVNIQNHSCTKRNILSTVARIFDPLGLVAPVTLYAKLLIKKLWSLHLDWDQCPPNYLVEQWSHFQLELPLLDKFSVPRHLGIFENSTATLVGFADACESSFGAAVYLYLDSNSEFKTSLICSKSKVSPLKVVSIPRLELCAAVLLAKLMKFVIDTYRSRYNLTKIFAFSDSTVVLHWIHSSPHRWKTFVANRVAKIHSYIPQNVWFHVDGKSNPADCLSRGMTPYRFMENSSTWLSGPSWLASEQINWPIQPFQNNEADAHFPEEKLISLPIIAGESNPLYSLISRHSSWVKLLRITVIVLRFGKILPLRKEILFIDLNKAEHTLVRIVQNKNFKYDIRALEKGELCSPQLRKLRPFLDNQLIRVGGRLSHSSLVYDHQHPILLPKKDPLVNILIDHYHRLYMHTGPHLLLALLRQKYWILSGRGIVRQRISLCNFCFRFRPRPTYPLMADLPPARVVTQVKPFIETGVDFAGPYYITLSRNRGVKSQKAYICLFVCLTTKCLHLELASDLSTATFIAAFKRFLSRRGPIKTLHSDCGTNFIGAKAHLDEFYSFIESSDYTNALKQELTQNKINWKFNTPSAPHMGGIWESNIKCVKTHLHKVLGSQILSYEEFATILTQIEALMNSRPLCWLSSDPSDPEVLTPAHFLTLTPLKILPAIDVSDEPLNRLDRQQLLDHLVQSYWRRWKTEYLSSLQIRQKWNSSSFPIQTGTLVLLMQDNVLPFQWPLGIIEEIFPGNDGVVRTVLVKTKNGLYKRPVVKLCPLPNQ